MYSTDKCHSGITKLHKYKVINKLPTFDLSQKAKKLQNIYSSWYLTQNQTEIICNPTEIFLRA